MSLPVAVVIPTIGRQSLDLLLASLGSQTHLPHEVVVVDDRRDADRALDGHLTPRVPASLHGHAVVVRSGGAGPAAARNRGWLATSSPWIVFLDDDVVPEPDWSDRLAADLHAGADVTQGRIRVPLPVDRRPTDEERNVARLEQAPWITADLAVRRDVLERLGGFDERFPRAYREDTDFALRAEDLAVRFAHGQRVTAHPVRSDPWNASVRRQRGNADDALLAALHGRSALDRGRRPRHLAIVGAAGVALAGVAARRWWLATIAALVWLAGTLEFWIARARGGPRSVREVGGLGVTSVMIPPAAVAHWLAGRARWRRIRTVDRWSPAMLTNAPRQPAPREDCESPRTGT